LPRDSEMNDAKLTNQATVRLTTIVILLTENTTVIGISALSRL
jgi:hypothetical protein